MPPELQQDATPVDPQEQSIDPPEDTPAVSTDAPANQPDDAPITAETAIETPATPRGPDFDDLFGDEANIEAALKHPALAKLVERGNIDAAHRATQAAEKRTTIEAGQLEQVVKTADAFARRVTGKSLAELEPNEQSEVLGFFQAHRRFERVEADNSQRARYIERYSPEGAAVTAAQTLADNGQTDEALDAIFDAAVEVRAKVLAATAETERGRRAKVEAKASAIETPNENPPDSPSSGTPAGGRPTGEQYLAAGTVRRAQWAKDGIEPLVPTA